MDFVMDQYDWKLELPNSFQLNFISVIFNMICPAIQVLTLSHWWTDMTFIENA
jgi:hypothetical protein